MKCFIYLFIYLFIFSIVEKLAEALRRFGQIEIEVANAGVERLQNCLLYTSPSPRDATLSRMPSSA